jgi:hypothetical protein
MEKHQRDPHDVNLALLRVPTIFGVNAYYVVSGFTLTCMLGPHVTGRSKLGGALLFLVVEAVMYSLSRDPMRLPILILSLRHRKAYCPLKRSAKW